MATTERMTKKMIFSDTEIEVLRGEVEIRKPIVCWPQQLFINTRICSIWQHVATGFTDRHIGRLCSLQLFCTQKNDLTTEIELGDICTVLEYI